MERGTGDRDETWADASDDGTSGGYAKGPEMGEGVGSRGGEGLSKDPNGDIKGDDQRGVERETIGTGTKAKELRG